MISKLVSIVILSIYLQAYQARQIQDSRKLFVQRNLYQLSQMSEGGIVYLNQNDKIYPLCSEQFNLQMGEIACGQLKNQGYKSHLKIKCELQNIEQFKSYECQNDDVSQENCVLISSQECLDKFQQDKETELCIKLECIPLGKDDSNDNNETVILIMIIVVFIALFAIIFTIFLLRYKKNQQIQLQEQNKLENNIREQQKQLQKIEADRLKIEQEQLQIIQQIQQEKNQISKQSESSKSGKNQRNEQLINTNQQNESMNISQQQQEDSKLQLINQEKINNFQENIQNNSLSQSQIYNTQQQQQQQQQQQNLQGSPIAIIQNQKKKSNKKISQGNKTKEINQQKNNYNNDQNEDIKISKKKSDELGLSKEQLSIKTGTTSNLNNNQAGLLQIANFAHFQEDFDQNGVICSSSNSSRSESKSQMQDPPEYQKNNKQQAQNTENVKVLNEDDIKNQLQAMLAMNNLKLEQQKLQLQLQQLNSNQRNNNIVQQSQDCNGIVEEINAEQLAQFFMYNQQQFQQQQQQQKQLEHESTPSSKEAYKNKNSEQKKSQKKNKMVVNNSQKSSQSSCNSQKDQVKKNKVLLQQNFLNIQPGQLQKQGQQISQQEQKEYNSQKQNQKQQD